MPKEQGREKKKKKQNRIDELIIKILIRKHMHGQKR